MAGRDYDSDDDREFQEWLSRRSRAGAQDEGGAYFNADDTAASDEFIAIMRAAAARRETGEVRRIALPRTQQPVFEPEDDEAIDQNRPVRSREDGEGFPPPSRRSRRREQRGRRAVGCLGGILRSFIIVITAAGLMATIFTWWTPNQFIAARVRQDLSIALATSAVTAQPTGLPTPNWAQRVGIVSGHRGPQNDPGAVCPDGLTEAEINFNVSQLVVRNLRGRGYTVDLLDEFDTRLDNYQAAALLSIHANTCQDFGEHVSGFLIAGPAARVSSRGNDELLVNCIARHYGLASGLQRREGVTVDMTHYHTFREIHPHTPAAIVELGFMLADRVLLTEHTDLLAQGLTDGLLCFLEPIRTPVEAPAAPAVEDVPAPQSAPEPGI